MASIPAIAHGNTRFQITLAAWLLFPAAALGQAQEQAAFRFQSGFWINLHHFLYRQAFDSAADKSAASMPSARAQAEAWNRALDYYQTAFAGKDLLQRDMAIIKNALSDAGSAASLKIAGLDADLTAVLEAAAPAYRARWREHDLRNRAWIRRLRPLLAEHERVLKGRLSSAYATAWPERAIRADIVFHANWAGAYTTLYPTRITIASNDPDESAAESLEILFHEASHVLIGKIREAISEQARSIGRLLPRKTLWHAVLFYTTGEIVRRRIPGYTPYALRHGLWERAWPDHLDALEAAWRPYLDGGRELDAAIRELVAGLAVAP